MSTRSGRISVSKLVALLVLMASVIFAEDKPEWISQPKSSDNMYDYVIGHAQYQTSEVSAREAAIQDARKRIASRIGGVDEPVPLSKIKGLEVVPGCVHTEKYRRDYECWVQVSYPSVEKKKLIAWLEKQANAEGDKPVTVNSTDAGQDNDSSGSKSARRMAPAKSDVAMMKDDASSDVATDEKDAGQKEKASGTGKSSGGTGGGASGTYPAEPFNGLQLRYSISGASLGKAEDKDGFTCTRSFKGTMGPGTLRVSGTSSKINGTVNTEYGNFAQICDVEVWVDGNKKSFHSKRPHEEAEGKPKGAKIDHGVAFFDLKVPVEEDTKSGGFSISMTFVNPRFGDRGLVVSGTLTGPAGSAEGSSSEKPDQSTYGTYVGKPDPQSDEEEAAWTIYRRYKAAKAKMDAYKSGVAGSQRDIENQSYGTIPGLFIDPSDIKSRSISREKVAAEKAKMDQMVELWENKGFSGYYGPLTDVDNTFTTKVFDPKTPMDIKDVTMDVIEFRLRSFHNLKKSKEQRDKGNQ